MDYGRAEKYVGQSKYWVRLVLHYDLPVLLTIEFLAPGSISVRKLPPANSIDKELELSSL